MYRLEKVCIYINEGIEDLVAVITAPSAPENIRKRKKINKRKGTKERKVNEIVYREKSSKALWQALLFCFLSSFMGFVRPSFYRIRRVIKSGHVFGT